MAKYTVLLYNETCGNQPTPKARKHWRQIYKEMNQFGGFFWLVLVCFGAILVHSGSFWNVLARYGSFSVLQLPREERN